MRNLLWDRESITYLMLFLHSNIYTILKYLIIIFYFAYTNNCLRPCVFDRCSKSYILYFHTTKSYIIKVFKKNSIISQYLNLSYNTFKHFTKFYFFLYFQSFIFKIFFIYLTLNCSMSTEPLKQYYKKFLNTPTKHFNKNNTHLT